MEKTLPQQIARENIRKRAFKNLADALKSDVFFPNNVFSGASSGYLFFPSDHMFVGTFVSAVKMLLDAENADVACLLNLSESAEMKFETASAIYMDQVIAGTSYETKLRGNGPSDGWIYSMNRYGCASNVGRWCMYCERTNDIAVVALQSVNDIVRFERPLALLKAGFLESLCGSGEKGVFPFNKLTPEWRDGLTRNYSRLA
jgi:hypothetical protein